MSVQPRPWVLGRPAGVAEGVWDDLPVPHTYECPMRWADMDLLGHVNNVTYLDYLAEARLNLFGHLPAGSAPVARHQVEFVAPLVFHRHPVLVDSWITGSTADEVALAHEVYDGQGDERTTYLRASTVLAHRLSEPEREITERFAGAALQWRPLAEGPAESRDAYSVAVRLSDLDQRGHASDVVHIEYFQEARIQYLMNLHTRGERWSHHVVARTDVTYSRPVPLRATPYAVHSWVGHLGTRSFTIRAELRDEVDVLATASVVMVAFDSDTQRPTDMTPSQRDRLRAELQAGLPAS